MKVYKNASGKPMLKLTKKEWLAIGKKAGFTKTANEALFNNVVQMISKQLGSEDPQVGIDFLRQALDEVDTDQQDRNPQNIDQDFFAAEDLESRKKHNWE